MYEEFEITGDDFEFGLPKKGDVSPVILVSVKSKKLQECFWKLYKTFPNQHTLINGEYDPHVTLCWLKD